MSEMKREMQGIKTAITDLAAIVNGRFETIDKRFDESDKLMKSEVKTIVHETVQAVIRDEMRGFLRPIAATLVQQTEELADLRSRMVTRDEFHSRMDAFSGLLLDSRQRWAVHADTLKQHDDRLTKLEKRPS